MPNFGENAGIASTAAPGIIAARKAWNLWGIFTLLVVEATEWGNASGAIYIGAEVRKQFQTLIEFSSARVERTLQDGGFGVKIDPDTGETRVVGSVTPTGQDASAKAASFASGVWERARVIITFLVKEAAVKYPRGTLLLGSVLFIAATAVFGFDFSAFNSEDPKKNENAEVLTLVAAFSLFVGGLCMHESMHLYVQKQQRSVKAAKAKKRMKQLLSLITEGDIRYVNTGDGDEQAAVRKGGFIRCGTHTVAKDYLHKSTFSQGAIFDLPDDLGSRTVKDVISDILLGVIVAQSEGATIHYDTTKTAAMNELEPDASKKKGETTRYLLTMMQQIFNALYQKSSAAGQDVDFATRVTRLRSEYEDWLAVTEASNAHDVRLEVGELKAQRVADLERLKATEMQLASMGHGEEAVLRSELAKTVDDRKLAHITKTLEGVIEEVSKISVGGNEAALMSVDTNKIAIIDYWQKRFEGTQFEKMVATFNAEPAVNMPALYRVRASAAVLRCAYVKEFIASRVDVNDLQLVVTTLLDAFLRDPKGLPIQDILRLFDGYDLTAIEGVLLQKFPPPPTMVGDKGKADGVRDGKDDDVDSPTNALALNPARVAPKGKVFGGAGAGGGAGADGGDDDAAADAAIEGGLFGRNMRAKDTDHVEVELDSDVRGYASATMMPPKGGSHTPSGRR